MAVGGVGRELAEDDGEILIAALCELSARGVEGLVLVESLEEVEGLVGEVFGVGVPENLVDGGEAIVVAVLRQALELEVEERVDEGGGR